MSKDRPRSLSRTLSTSSSACWDRWGSGGGGGGGGGGAGGAVVVVLQVQFIDKVVDVLMQLNFQQSRVVCTGSSSTECWTFQLRTERYPQCKLCRRLFLASTSL